MSTNVDLLRSWMRGIGRTIPAVILAFVAGCAGTLPEGDAEEETTAPECPAWKIAVEVDGRIQCVDEQILEREREIIDLDDDW